MTVARNAAAAAFSAVAATGVAVLLGAAALPVSGSDVAIHPHGMHAVAAGAATPVASASASAGMPPMPGMSMPAAVFSPNLDPGETVDVKSIPPITPATAKYDEDLITHREFQANCVPNHTAGDDAIVYPSKPGAAHNHTFMGAVGVDAYTTTGSLAKSKTTCNVPDDHSAYWFPTLFAGDRPIVSNKVQTVYYKAAITDYRSVRPFPRGLRFVAGDMKATPEQFKNAPGSVVGWECGKVIDKYEFGEYLKLCEGRGNLNIRFKAPSCWDGVHLDSPNHKSHMAYPIQVKRATVCPSSHPIAVPMLEFKLNFPLKAVGQDISKLRLSSGGGSSWHYDFFNSWEPKTLAAMVTHCLNGGLQCNTYGEDGYKKDRGRVLDAGHRLLKNPAR